MIEDDKGKELAQLIEAWRPPRRWKLTGASRGLANEINSGQVSMFPAEVKK